ncbi:MAG: response regulator [Lachnospiraceae bacterium]|nr:response regulator [Lachnospiraceae bacterium]
MLQQKILAIDDSVIVIKQLQSILEREYYFKGVTSGLAALKILDTEPVDLVLLDLEMPVMDGFATLTAIRQREHLKELPIVILTGNNHKQKVIKGITSGVAGYIVKPADSELLLEKIRNALKRNEE